MMERKTLGFEVKDVDEETGIFTGYAATFSKRPDCYGDIIDPGAFKKTLKEDRSRIVILWNHDAWEPIGKPLELSEDAKGLLVKGQLTLGVQRAREILALMKAGVVSVMSIGFQTVKQVNEEGIRHLKELKLFDVSPVTFAANPEAVILNVKQESSTAAVEAITVAGEKLATAVDAFQALLDSVGRRSEPEESTQELDAEEGAAEELEGATQANTEGDPDKGDDPDMQRLVSSVGTLKAMNEGFDVRAAEARIQSMLDRINPNKE